MNNNQSSLREKIGKIISRSAVKYIPNVNDLLSYNSDLSKDADAIELLMRDEMKRFAEWLNSLSSERWRTSDELLNEYFSNQTIKV